MAEPEIRENWSRAERSLAYRVEVEGAPLLVIPGPTQLPRLTFRRYQLHRVDITTTWTGDGDQEAGELYRQVVVLRVWEVIGDRVLKARDGKLYPDQLREVPDWLERIILSASPRDVG